MDMFKSENSNGLRWMDNMWGHKCKVKGGLYICSGLTILIIEIRLTYTKKSPTQTW